MATLLITNLITGTSAGDTLIQNIVPIVAACNSKAGPSKRNLGMKTPLIRGKLNLVGHANPELAEGYFPRASVETLYGVSVFGQRESPLPYENGGLSVRCGNCHPEKVPGLIMR